MDEPQSFRALEQISLTDLRGDSWDGYYAATAPWLGCADADIRERAINRLFTAVLWSEPQAARDEQRTASGLPNDTGARIAWLLATLETAHKRHADIIPFSLDHLRFQGGTPDDPVTRWLERLRLSPPPAVDPAMIEGTLLLRQPLDEDDPADVARVVALLDHPSDYLRACAARTLSAMDGEALDATTMFALIHDKEIARPGIAGPYWSEWQFCREHVPIDPIEWMMDILERRSGPEPDDMPFNGIDFYLHEICDRSPETVQRMIRGGHVQIAIETATETPGTVHGMEPVLRTLADNPDVHVRSRAQSHLAHYYRFLHQEAGRSGGIRRWPEWSPEAEVFSFHFGDDRKLWFVVIHPRAPDGRFTEEEAWSLVDRALPPDLRGAIDFHALDFEKKQPAPHRLGDQLMWRFTSGANLSMHGDPDAKVWSRIDIGGAHLGARWNPFGA
jgi:hypothetical protein